MGRKKNKRIKRMSDLHFKYWENKEVFYRLNLLSFRNNKEVKHIARKHGIKTKNREIEDIVEEIATNKDIDLEKIHKKSKTSHIHSSRQEALQSFF
jgi:hypothetical protein